MLTVADGTGGQFQFRTIIDVRPSATTKPPVPNSFRVELRHAGGIPVKWDLPPGSRVREVHAGPDLSAWVIDLMPGSHRLMLASERRPLALRQETVMPEVTVQPVGSASTRSQQIGRAHV